MLHSIGGQVNSTDVRMDRIAAGTVGGEQVVPSSIRGGRMASLVDNMDARITYGVYGSGSVSFTSVITSAFSRMGTYVFSSSANAAIQLKFDGNSVGVVGMANQFGDSAASVYIDGVAAYGRIPTMTTFRFPSDFVINTPAIDDDTTNITAYSTSGFSASGYLIIGDEVIKYSSISSGDFIIEERGAQGTKKVDHNVNETIYQWSNVLSFYNSSGNSTGQLLWYNPFLANGPHTVTIVCSGGGKVYFDSFVVGSLIGASSMALQVGTLTTSCSTSANGHGEFNIIQTSNADVQLVGVIGYAQTSPDAYSDNATTMARLGVKWPTSSGSLDALPVFYVHNGAAGTTVTVQITFAYIGETIR